MTTRVLVFDSKQKPYDAGRIGIASIEGDTDDVDIFVIIIACKLNNFN